MKYKTQTYEGYHYCWKWVFDVSYVFIRIFNALIQPHYNIRLLLSIKKCMHINNYELNQYPFDDIIASGQLDFFYIFTNSTNANSSNNYCILFLRNEN